MKQAYYIFNSGTLRRKDNTLRFETQNGDKRDIPIERISELYCFGETNFNSHLLSIISQYGICVHTFGYYGSYTGTFYPKESLLSGRVHIAQAQHYIDPDKRIIIAKEVLSAAMYNIIRNLRYYNERERNFDEQIANIRMLQRQIDNAATVSEIMGYEGSARKQYYSCWNDIMRLNNEFKGRVYHPPDNMINSLISFCNSLVYSKVITSIYNTQLDPTISYLHEPGTRRFSLSLDIAEVFKPLLADRLIFALINKRQITDTSFEANSNGVLLKDTARKTVVAEFDKRLKQTIMHKKLNREVSYERLIRLELYKLVKHVLDEQKYEGFKIWW